MVSVCLHQPNFIPWTKLLAKIMASDVYVAYDSVQFTRAEYHNRQRIKARRGPIMLSAPVLRAKSRQRLCDVHLDPSGEWRGYHLRILEQEYRRSPYFAEFFPVLQDVYGRRQSMLVDFNLDLLMGISRFLGRPCDIVRATDLPHSGDNTDRLIQLTVAVGGDEHVTSTWGTERQYIDWARVADAGIKIRSQVFRHPIYPQQFDPTFVANLGVIDMIFAEGTKSALLIAGSSDFPLVSG